MFKAACISIRDWCRAHPKFTMGVACVLLGVILAKCAFAAEVIPGPEIEVKCVSARKVCQMSMDDAMFLMRTNRELGEGYLELKAELEKLKGEKAKGCKGQPT